MKRSFRKYTACATVLLTAILAGTLGIAAIRDQSTTILDTAQKVAVTANWNEGSRFNTGIEPSWVSDHELIYGQFDQHLSGDPSWQRGNCTVFLRDTRTGRETPLPGLTKNRDKLDCEVSDGHKMSPDGRWLLYSARWGDCLVAEVRGHRFEIVRSDKSDEYRGLLWLPDSRHWLEKLGSVSWLHDVDRPGYRQRITTPIEWPDVLAGTDLDTIGLVTNIDAVDPAGDQTSTENTKHEYNIVTHPFSHPDRLSAAFVATPKCLQVDEIECSTDHTHIMWLLRTAHMRPFNNLLTLLRVPGSHPARYIANSLWVSDIEGKHWRRLGDFPIEDAGTSGSDNEDPAVSWLPGGRKLGFEYHNVLYTVPVE